MAFYVYIVTSQRNGTLYIGHTENIERKAYEHRNGALRGFASKYGCKRLVWYGSFGSRDAAQTRERQMKAWRRERKISLIEKDNPGWRDLSDGWYPLGPRHYRLAHHPAAVDSDIRQEGGNSGLKSLSSPATPAQAGVHGGWESPSKALR